MTRMTEAEKVFTPGEMARLFRVDPKTVCRWDTSGKFAAAGIRVFRTPGGTRRYAAADVERYLAEHTIERDGGES